jgi:hypothetical protein
VSLLFPSNPGRLNPNRSLICFRLQRGASVPSGNVLDGLFLCQQR